MTVLIVRQPHSTDYAKQIVTWLLETLRVLHEAHGWELS